MVPEMHQIQQIGYLKMLYLTRTIHEYEMRCYFDKKISKLAYQVLRQI